MIYFNRRLQDRGLGLFHESLCHRGFLGLGSKESIDFSALCPSFEPLAKRDRLFRKGADHEPGTDARTQRWPAAVSRRW
jgi:chemotaxis protein methyltransferase CheR